MPEVFAVPHKRSVCEYCTVAAAAVEEKISVAVAVATRKAAHQVPLEKRSAKHLRQKNASDRVASLLDSGWG